MATIIGSTNNAQWTFKLESYETSVNYTDNYSIVRVDVYIGRASSRSYCGGNFSGSVTVDGQEQGFSGSISYPTYIDGGAWHYTGVTKDFTVYHNSDGNKYIGVSASWSANFSPSSASANGGYSLTYIPRQANITSAPNFTDEDKPTINYSNPAGNAVAELKACISFTGARDDIVYRDISKTDSSYTFDLTDSERDLLRQTCTNKSMTVKFYIRTVIGSNTYFSIADRTLTIANANPVFSNFTYADTNTRVTTITQDNQVLVKGISNLKVTISSANKMTTKKYATPVSYTTTIGTNVVNTNYSTSDLVIDVGTVSVGGVNQLKVSAIDSRSNDTTVSKNVTVLDYSNVTLLTNVKRVEPTTGEVKVTYSGNWFNANIGQTPNTLTIIWKYKEHNADEWINGGTLTPTIQNNTFNGEESLGSVFNYQKQYDIQFIASDLFSDFSTENSVAKGIPIFWWNERQVTLEGDLKVNGSFENLSIGKMTTNDEKTITSQQKVTDIWSKDFELGDISVDITNGRIAVTNTEYLEVGGIIGGRGNSWSGIYVYESSSNSPLINNNSIRNLNQFGSVGNSYWSNNIPTTIYKIDKDKTYYVYLVCATYSGTFYLNNGLGNDNTSIYAKKLM